VLDVKANTIKVTGFDNKGKATDALNALEKGDEDDAVDAVLVWVKSVADLKAAYPNYYADTGEFIDALNEAIRG
jgi:hypothetical protein